MSLAECPKCGTVLSIEVATPNERPCFTCGRPLSAHIEKYGHVRWCEFTAADRKRYDAPGGKTEQ
jgi:hypothetical protein